jgi:meso-butanediol dehydrogenase/(S,S)-butanediol dehydrogenase/diacetyl reductase
MTRMRMQDKVTLVTGGGSGIGRATSLLLASEGAAVAIADKNKDAAEAVAAECGKHGKAVAIAGDVSRSADARRMVDETVEALGRLDVLINNAGYGIAGSVVETDEQAWDDLMAVNVRGVFLCSKFAIPVMKAQGGGVIVNTASSVASMGIRNRAAYVASKGAVAALTRAIALDHAADGIRCNAVAPGTIDTPYFSAVLKNNPNPADSRKALEARQILNRLGTPEEVAYAILYLASDESSFATGSILAIDGGMTAF